MKEQTLTLTLLTFGLLFGGCDGDEKTSADDAASACAHDRLESDLELSDPIGPAVDPATGKIALDPGQGVIVSSTYGVPRPGSDGAPTTERYRELFAAIEQELSTQKGLLALQLGASTRCGSGRTLAIWRSEEEMYDFVTSRAHLDAMREANTLLEPGYAVTHWQANEPAQLTIEAAIQQLAKVESSGQP